MSLKICHDGYTDVVRLYFIAKILTVNHQLAIDIPRKDLKVFLKRNIHISIEGAQTPSFLEKVIQNFCFNLFFQINSSLL